MVEVRVEIDGLVGGYTGRCSAEERGLLEYALGRYGKWLSQLILAGLGEEDGARKWRFAARFSDAVGESRERIIEITSGDVEDSGNAGTLPCGREPLVLVTLLLLYEAASRPPSGVLSYEQKDVLRLSGWEDTAENRDLIDGAVRWYFMLSYDWSLSEHELSERGLFFYEGSARLVSGYSRQDDEEGGQVKRTTNEISFCQELVGEFGRRAPFGIDWDAVRSLVRMTD